MPLLTWIARHGPLLMAVGVLLGIAAPPLAALLHPLLVPTLMLPLTLALLRLDWRAIGGYRRHKLTIVAIVAWLLAVSPALVWIITSAAERAGLPRPLQTAVVLMAASSPIVSSVAIALMVQLDATLAVVAVLVSTALVPFTLPFMSSVLLGLSLEIPLPVFMARLAALVGGAFLAAWLLRRFTPLTTHRDGGVWIDVLTVLSLVVFAIAIMDGVTAFALSRPVYAAIAVALAFAANLGLQAAAALVFRGLGNRKALTVGLMSGNCNMGLVLVALEGRASFEVTVFFALAQLPMYVLPALLAPVYRHLVARRPAGVGTSSG
ncbi:MAG TPA: hypothetical protein VFC24_03100 [Casimicrobiaceae bacterium]|nr:hypothetical protein [Casimicrobiaceae bacterium]